MHVIYMQQAPHLGSYQKTKDKRQNTKKKTNEKIEQNASQ